jgi:molybdopterin/thiamine biosynthesis adenylyltransferase
MNYIIGAGGVGSLLMPSFCKLVGKRQVTVVDGDTLEEKNLDRQLFEPNQIGRNKAWALAAKYNCQAITEYYSMGRFPIIESDWLLVCVDNHPARLAALNECDARGCSAIFGCNETHSAEAFYYTSMWRGTDLDPRVYYPEILTDHQNDPMARAIGCTGEAQERNVQLVSANFMAAALMQQLYVVWAMEAPKMEAATLLHLPLQLISTLTRIGCVLVKDKKLLVELVERTD